MLDLVIVSFSSKLSCAVLWHGHFSLNCEFHLSTSFQRVKHWFKVSEHIFEMLALMGILLVSFCLSGDYQSRCHSHLWSKYYFSTFNGLGDLFHTRTNISVPKFIHTVLITY